MLPRLCELAEENSVEIEVCVKINNRPAIVYVATRNVYYHSCYMTILLPTYIF